QPLGPDGDFHPAAAAHFRGRRLRHECGGAPLDAGQGRLRHCGGSLLSPGGGKLSAASQIQDSSLSMQALIFDFDGVIADSETLANLALAGLITDLGVPTTLDQSIARYTGKRLHEVVAAVEADLGRPIPGNFAEMLKAEIFKRFRADLEEVEGARAFIEKFCDVPRCIASSSAP